MGEARTEIVAAVLLVVIEIPEIDTILLLRRDMILLLLCAMSRRHRRDMKLRLGTTGVDLSAETMREEVSLARSACPEPDTWLTFRRIPSGTSTAQRSTRRAISRDAAIWSSTASGRQA
jgi:hypothetical protein